MPRGRPPKSVTKKVSIINKIEEMKATITGTVDFNKINYIPDIITFCYDQNYLNFKEQGLKLRPFQEILLKVFYRGSFGNENLKLTEEEIELCKKHELNNPENGDILGKYDSDATFRELVIVWGRRSGKGFFQSIIAAYEAMKLLECKGGDPYVIYNISKAQPISILTIANSGDQAEGAFKEIRSRLLESKYFSDKIIAEGVETKRIFILTKADKIKNQELTSKGYPVQKGSIVVEVGHSNADTLRGKQVIVGILDEVAMYKQTGGSSSGEEIYKMMTPALSTFKRIENDKNGKEIIIYDSKIISISSPKGEEGIFYKLFVDTPKVKTRLSIRQPSWIVNPTETEESLREVNSQMTDEEFLMEIGAEFSGTGGSSFFLRESVEDCFKPGYKLEEYGKPGKIYFAHLDPATSSHNYALVVVHKEIYYNEKEKKPDFYIVVDHIKYWHPTPTKHINNDMIDDYVIGLKNRFHLGLVTYDSWNSINSINKLRQSGIPAKMTRYTKRFKMIIYDEINGLVNTNRLKIPIHSLLRAEMIGLQRRFSPPTGFKVYPKGDSDVNTDDLIDALSGACYQALCQEEKRLPCGTTVNMPMTMQSGQRQWNTMSGPIGYGTGGQVARELEKRSSYFRNQR